MAGENRGAMPAEGWLALTLAKWHTIAVPQIRTAEPRSKAMRHCGFITAGDSRNKRF